MRKKTKGTIVSITFSILFFLMLICVAVVFGYQKYFEEWPFNPKALLVTFFITGTFGLVISLIMLAVIRIEWDD